VSCRPQCSWCVIFAVRGELQARQVILPAAAAANRQQQPSGREMHAAELVVELRASVFAVGELRQVRVVVLRESDLRNPATLSLPFCVLTFVPRWVIFWPARAC